MDNLDEILIVKNNKSLTYINKKGFEIIDEIQLSILGKYIQGISDIFSLPNLLFLSQKDLDPTATNKKRSLETEKLTELILNHKFFNIC